MPRAASQTRLVGHEPEEPCVLTGFRRPECEFWWSVYDAQFTGSASGAFLDGEE